MKFKEKARIKISVILVNTIFFFEKLISGVSLNIFSAGFRENPYPYFEKIRETHPIYYSKAIRSWWVTKFDYAQEILLDKRFGSDIRKYKRHVDKILPKLDKERREVFENPNMLYLDPPEHSRVRRLISQAFTLNFIKSLEPRVEQIIEECFKEVESKSTFDLVSGIAKPLPAIVIAELLGLPESDREKFQVLTSDFLAGKGGATDSEKISKGRIASTKLLEYFREIVKKRRDAPTDDLVGHLIKAEEEGDKLTEFELYNTCLLMLVAGHETTSRLISNTVFLSLKSSVCWESLKKEPSKISNVIEEVLRFEPPVQVVKRYATQDMEFHGNTFKEGDEIYISIAAGNRDPACNDDPNKFDIDRASIKKLSFGHGIHMCIGSSLARMEAKLVLEKLLLRFPNIRLTDNNPKWEGNLLYRGHEKLMLSIDSA